MAAGSGDLRADQAFELAMVALKTPPTSLCNRALRTDVKAYYASIVAAMSG